MGPAQTPLWLILEQDLGAVTLCACTLPLPLEEYLRDIQRAREKCRRDWPALAAGQSFLKEPLVSELGAPCHKSVPDHQQRGHERGANHRRHKGDREGLRGGRHRTGCTAAKRRASTLCRQWHSWHQTPRVWEQTKYHVCCLENVVEKINFWSLPPTGYAKKKKKKSFYQITVLQNSELNLSKQRPWISQPLIVLNGIDAVKGETKWASAKCLTLYSTL